MSLSFSIRDYTAQTRRADVDKCWPFDAEEPIKSLPSMDVRKSRWWAHEMNKLKKAKKRKRSISDLFASAPQITALETGSDAQDQDLMMKEVKKKRLKCKNKLVDTDESKLDGCDEDLKKRVEKKKKLKKKKLKSEIFSKTKNKTTIHNSPDKLDESSGNTNGEHKSQSQSKLSNIEIEEEPEELLPLISLLRKKCKRDNRTKKGKNVTFSENEMEIVAQNMENGDKKENANKALLKSIDLNQAIVECIDLNEDPNTETETEKLDLNIQNESNAKHGLSGLDFTDVNLNCSTISSKGIMQPKTVRLMGKSVMIGTDFKAPETSSSSYASCSNHPNNENNCSHCEINFGAGNFTSSTNNYMPITHYMVGSPTPVISFPVLPSCYNVYHPQFPVISPMISFPLGGSIFSQPYHASFSVEKTKEEQRKMCPETELRLAHGAKLS